MTTKAIGTQGIQFPDGSVQSTAAFGLPSGMVGEFAMATPPAGWLACDGSAVSRTTYAALFAALGTVWGVGDGSTTFNLPDFRGAFRRGLGTGGGNQGTSAALGTFQAQQLNNHTHAYQLPGAAAQGTTAGNSINAGSLASNQTGGAQGQAVGTIGSELRPGNFATLVCIKV